MKPKINSMGYGSNKDDNPLPLRRTFLLRGPEATYLLAVEIEQLQASLPGRVVVYLFSSLLRGAPRKDTVPRYLLRWCLVLVPGAWYWYQV